MPQIVVDGHIAGLVDRLHKIVQAARRWKPSAPATIGLLLERDTFPLTFAVGIGQQHLLDPRAWIHSLHAKGRHRLLHIHLYPVDDRRSPVIRVGIIDVDGHLVIEALLAAPLVILSGGQQQCCGALSPGPGEHAGHGGVPTHIPERHLLLAHVLRQVQRRKREARDKGLETRLVAVAGAIKGRAVSLGAL